MPIINPHFGDTLILIRGGGDLASGVAYRLKRAGFPLLITELPTPLLVRRTVSFGDAVYEGRVEIEGVVAQRVECVDEAVALATSATIPVLVDPRAASVTVLSLSVLVDGIMAKRNTGTSIEDASLVIGLGPGFEAGRNCHVAVETQRGHRLGRLIYDGATAADTGTPGVVAGRSTGRVLRAPADGHVTPAAQIGDWIETGTLIAAVDGLGLRAPFAGRLRGLIHPKAPVRCCMKIGDLDPRGDRENCFTISDKSLAIGGAVLEAILANLIGHG